MKEDSEVKVVFFMKSGPRNTRKTLELAKRRAKQLGIKDIVVASTHGGTALKAAKVFKDMKVNIIAVTLSGDFSREGWVMKPDERKNLETKGIKVLTSGHPLGEGVARDLVAGSFYRLSQGTKVAVEITLTAADAGLVKTDREVIAIAGTHEGCDTAIVIKPSYPQRLNDLEIREVLAKPRFP